MSWTNASIIKLHMQALGIEALQVDFHPVHLYNDQILQLPHAVLAADSVKVYMLQEQQPSGPHVVTLSGTGWISLGYGPLFPQSVVLSKTWLLRDRYLEGIDFAVDETNGQVKRLDGGSISPGQEVKAWCLPIHQFTEDVDFEVDYTSGKIKRTSGGNIPDTAWLLVSYSTSAIGASDALIGQAIEEAEAKINDRLKEGYSISSSDSGLEIGTTELTLSLLCDDLALHALTGVGDASADDRARRFLELSKRYEERAVSTLSKFLRLPLPSVSTRQSNTPLTSGW